MIPIQNRTSYLRLYYTTLFSVLPIYILIHYHIIVMVLIYILSLVRVRCECNDDVVLNHWLLVH